MPEVSEDAAILIATSWQALERTKLGIKVTSLCDCTIVILFASFFIESNLNYIIEKMNKTNEMRAFLKVHHPGLESKLCWYYNKFIARLKAANKKQLSKGGIRKKIRRKFPGFSKLHNFRNDISHGVINHTAGNLNETMELRKQAKDIVDKLFEIAGNAGYHIPRVVTYNDAISNAG